MVKSGALFGGAMFGGTAAPPMGAVTKVNVRLGKGSIRSNRSAMATFIKDAEGLTCN